jgi:hypothetical protein
MKHFILLLVSIVFFSECLPAQVYVSRFRYNSLPDPNFHIYICFGQSNMEVLVSIEPEDTAGVDT